MIGAEFSDDGVYRYRLWREWDADGLRCLFVMLNPSTADAVQDDPTIRRCIGFAKTWGYGRIEVVNLFAYRATDPQTLYHIADPVGPLNDDVILKAAEWADLVVCGWGAQGIMRGRSQEVRDILAGVEPHSLRLTKGGEPGHPLYLGGNLRPVPLAPRSLTPATAASAEEAS